MHVSGATSYHSIQSAHEHTPVSSASTTQMARVSVITVDNGCGSPLTSATTGNANTQTHTHTHACTHRIFFQQPVEARQDYNSWTGR